MKYAALLLAVVTFAAHAAEYVAVRGGTFASVLPADDKAADVNVAPYRLRSEPVTNAEFLAFVIAHPQWRRTQTARVFAEQRYLVHWSDDLALGSNAAPEQPVVQVSW